jgi:divalent metal cation (Fe/Co/Zn/Cd) transporter
MGEFDATTIMGFVIALLFLALGISTVYQAATAQPDQDLPNVGIGSAYMVGALTLMYASFQAGFR